MIKKNLQEILSLNGVSILIGIVGGILGIISIFIDWNSKISIKWFALILIIFSFLLLISVVLLFEIYKSHKFRENKHLKVIQYSNENSLLLVENNNSLEFSQTVSIFYTFNNLQILLAIGFVENIQENFVQIKIINYEKEFIRNHRRVYETIISNDKNALDLILIKNYLRYGG